jgi:hypothetical protein
VFSPAKVIFAGVGILLLVCTLPHASAQAHLYTDISQAAKDVRAGQDALVDVFERIESFFRRLEIYTSVPPNQEMVDTITTIMVEVLCILAIATKEIKQGRTSKSFAVLIMSPLTKIFLEKYLKKLVGRSKIEDALKRLDKLTQEEARMATAQVLKVMHTVDDRVLGVDNRVAGVDDRVAGVGDRVASVDDRVKAIDDKVVAVIDGAHYIFAHSFIQKMLTQCA